MTIADLDHSVGEERYMTLGSSAQGRLLVVAHTDVNDAIRLISARPAQRRASDARMRKAIANPV